MAKRTTIEATVRPMKAVPAAPAAGAATVSANGVPAEVIAAISGAVACMFGAGASVVGIRPAKRDRAGRSAWSSAGLLDATRAF